VLPRPPPPKNRTCEFPRIRLKPFKAPGYAEAGNSPRIVACSFWWQTGWSSCRLDLLSDPPSERNWT